MKKLLLALLIGLLFLPAISQAQESDTRQTPDEICASAPNPAPEPATREYTQPEQVLETGVDYAAVLCTESGAVYVDLFETLAPLTVNSFVFLSQNGFYNNTTFHRVLADFMAQGGDPTGTGSGGPGYTVLDEYVAYMTFDRPWLLATANSNNRDAGRTDTNGSQFFITTVVTDWLNYNHTIFGEVLSGQDVVAGLRLRDPQTDTTPGAALNTIVIVTDPNSVISGFEPPAPATRADFEEALTALEGLDWAARDVENTGVFDADVVVSRLPESIQADATAFFEQYELQFTAQVRDTNAECDVTAIPATSLSETIHVFSSKENAVSAQNDPVFTTLVTLGSSDVTTGKTSYYGLPIYRWTSSECGVDVIQARAIRQLGRMLIITELAYVVGSDIDEDSILDDVNISYYDVGFTTLFRAEANQ